MSTPIETDNETTFSAQSNTTVDYINNTMWANDPPPFSSMNDLSGALNIFSQIGISFK